MSASATRPRRLQRHTPLLVGALTTLLLSAGTLAFVAEEERRTDEAVRAEVVAEGTGLRAELERAVDARTTLLAGLEGFAQAELGDGGIDPDNFERFATRITDQTDVPVRSVQLAPQAVVTYVHPVEGNEGAIGHDLLNDPDRRQSVLDTIAAGAPVVAGPLELLQGGRAIIIRSPIFHGQTQDGAEQWWGLATVVADFDPIVTESGLDRVAADREVAVQFLEGRRNDFGREVFGDLDLFARDPVTFDVALPTGRWEIGLAPVGGWEAVGWPNRTSTTAGGILLALLAGLLVHRILDGSRRYQRVSDDLAELIDTAGVPILQLDLRGRVVGWNRATEELTGVDRDTALGTRLWDPASERMLAGPVDDPDLGRALGELLRSGEADRGREVALDTPAGSRQLLVNAAPRRSASGSITGVVIVVQDLSDRAEAEEVRAENVAMARTARMKDEFLASMSHELRTPLNGILGLSSLLEARTFGELNDKQAEYVGHIRASGQHLLALINDILDLARIEASHEELDLAAIDVADLVREAVTLTNGAAADKDLRVDVSLARDVPPVRGDRRRLVQVLVNLLGNAVKFTPEGGTIGVTTDADERHLRMTVWDTGIGIPPQKQSLLFQPFQQVDASLTRAHGGTGLGLSLTSRLVELHDGTIEVESDEGAGARFTVTLPLAGPRPDAGDTGDGSSAEPPPTDAVAVSDVAGPAAAGPR